MAQKTENTRPQYVEPAEIAEIETTRAFPFADVQLWQTANRPETVLVPVSPITMLDWTAAITYGAVEIKNGVGRFASFVPSSDTPPYYLSIAEALRHLEAQARAMEQLRAALPELEGCEGIEIHTMDSLLDKLCGPQLEEAEAEGWQAEAPSTSEMEALVGMQEEDGAEGLRGADRADWVLVNAGSEETSGLDLRDQVTDMITDLLLLVHRDRPDLDALRILANAVSHMQTEIHPDGEDDPLRVTWIMGTEGDGWEVQLHDGRVVRMVVKA